MEGLCQLKKTGLVVHGEDCGGLRSHLGVAVWGRKGAAEVSIGSVDAGGQQQPWPQSHKTEEEVDARAKAIAFQLRLLHCSDDECRIG